MVLTAERGRDGDRPPEVVVVDIKSGSLDGASSSSIVDRQDSLFREAVTGHHHRAAGGAGHADHVRTLLDVQVTLESACNANATVVELDTSCSVSPCFAHLTDY